MYTEESSVCFRDFSKKDESVRFANILVQEIQWRLISISVRHVFLLPGEGGRGKRKVPMRTFRRTGLLCTALLLPLLLLLWPTLGQTPRLIPQPAAATRAPSALVFRPDGRTLYVAEQNENRVAVLDAASGKSLALIPTGGEQPTGLALSPDGRTLAVTNCFSGSLGILDAERHTLRARVPLLGEPYDVVISASGEAFVSVSQLDQVAVVDLASARVIARIPVGRRPRALRLTPDGTTLLCANLTGGSLSEIDVATHKEKARIALPAINLRGIALSADGTEAFVTGQQPHNDLPTERPEAMWTNVLCILRLANGTASVERVIPLDQPEYGAADPCGVVLNAGGDTALLTLSGTHEVAVVPLRGVQSAADAGAIRRIPVEANPRALALQPRTGDLWVADYLSNALTVLSGHTLNSTRRVALDAPTPSPARRTPGLFLFTSAHLTRGMHFTCETCHPDETEEGLSWKFAHVKDGIELRNTRDLRGNLLLTAPYGWMGREEDFEVFVNDELVGLMRTHRLPHSEVHAFWDLINESPLPPNPYRAADGSFTVAARRGKELFEGKAACVTCHEGNERGGSNKREWIGTTPEDVKLDVPHLIGAYESAPYLHDGRAATLEEIFTKYNPDHKHGKAHLLSPEELHDLLEYVREL